jgi:hypothetical protein
LVTENVAVQPPGGGGVDGLGDGGRDGDGDADGLGDGGRDGEADADGDGGVVFRPKNAIAEDACTGRLCGVFAMLTASTITWRCS